MGHLKPWRPLCEENPGWRFPWPQSKMEVEYHTNGRGLNRPGPSRIGNAWRTHSWGLGTGSESCLQDWGLWARSRWVPGACPVWCPESVRNKLRIPPSSLSSLWCGRSVWTLETGRGMAGMKEE